MMNKQAIQRQLKDKIAELLPRVCSEFGNTFNLKCSISATTPYATGVDEIVTGETFPRLYVLLNTGGPVELEHVVSVPDELLQRMSEGSGKAAKGHSTAPDLKRIEAFIGESIRKFAASSEAHLKAVTIVNSAEAAMEFQSDTDPACWKYGLELGDLNCDVNHYVRAREKNGNPGGKTARNRSGETEPFNVASLNSFDAAGSNFEQPGNIDLLLDVELEVTVELGTRNMYVRDILKLGRGSVIELDRAAGDLLDIYVNGHKLAEGEVVVVDDHFGIRITQLVSPTERIKSLE